MSKKMIMAAALALCAAAGSAHAGYTVVNIGNSAATRGAVTGGGTGAPSSEGGTNNSIVNILSHIYNGTTSTSGITGSIEGDMNLGGGITARRIADFGGDVFAQILHLASGSAGALDQVWQDGVVQFEARARYAGYEQHFGFQTLDNANNLSGAGFGGPSIHVQNSGSGFTAFGSETFNIGSPVNFTWMRANNAAGTSNAQYSLASLNVAQRDQMVAWEILGTGGRRYVLAFEDINQGGSPDDRDFNDLVIELVVIPLPSGAGLTMAGMTLLAFRRRRTA
jgi:hypothetical protein